MQTTKQSLTKQNKFCNPIGKDAKNVAILNKFILQKACHPVYF